MGRRKTPLIGAHPEAVSHVRHGSYATPKARHYVSSTRLQGTHSAFYQTPHRESTAALVGDRSVCAGMRSVTQGLVRFPEAIRKRHPRGEKA